MNESGPVAAPKPSLFEDPAVGALYQMVLALAEEVAALREVVDAGFALQANGQPATPEAMANYVPDEDYDQERAARVQRLMAPLDELLRAEAASR